MSEQNHVSQVNNNKGQVKQVFQTIMSPNLLILVRITIQSHLLIFRILTIDFYIICKIKDVLGLKNYIP